MSPSPMLHHPLAAEVALLQFYEELRFRVAASRGEGSAASMLAELGWKPRTHGGQEGVVFDTKRAPLRSADKTQLEGGSKIACSSRREQSAEWS